MHDIDKFRRKLLPEERYRIDDVLSCIRDGNLSGLDIKKLKGVKNTFRVRVGRFRIKFVKTEKYGFVVIEVGNRDNNTY